VPRFRGPSITTTGLELARRGYALDGALESTNVQGDGTGAFMVYDPDGHRMFFNTHALAIATSDGPALVDADGNRVTWFPSRAKAHSPRS